MKNIPNYTLFLIRGTADKNFVDSNDPFIELEDLTDASVTAQKIRTPDAIGYQIFANKTWFLNEPIFFGNE